MAYEQKKYPVVTPQEVIREKFSFILDLFKYEIHTL